MTGEGQSERHLVSSATACPAPNSNTAFLSPVLTSQRAEVAFFMMWWHMDCSMSLLNCLSKVRMWAGCNSVVERSANGRPWGSSSSRKQNNPHLKTPSRQQQNVGTVYYSIVQLLVLGHNELAFECP